jgi:hypothetical protein
MTYMSSKSTPYLANIITTCNLESRPITRITTTSGIKSVFLTFNIHLPQNRSELEAAACNQMHNKVRIRMQSDSTKTRCSGMHCWTWSDVIRSNNQLRLDATMQQRLDTTKIGCDWVHLQQFSLPTSRATERSMVLMSLKCVLLTLWHWFECCWYTYTLTKNQHWSEFQIFSYFQQQCSPCWTKGCWIRP